MDSLFISAFQLNLIWHDAAANQAHINRIAQAHQPKGHLWILPEMFTTGFSMEPAGFAERTDGATATWMKRMASDYEAQLMGSLIVEEDSNYCNRAILVSKNGLEGYYDKRHGFSLTKEDEIYRSGTEKVIFQIDDWKVCPQICYDLRFPVFSRNRVDEAGQYEYDLAVYMANWPHARVHHWEALLQARAIENQCFVVGVNRVGEDANGLYYSGSSMVVDPMGKILAKVSGGEAVLEAELSAEFLQQIRQKYPFWKDADGFQIVP